MYIYGMYTYGMYTYGMYTYCMYTYGMYTYGMQGMRQDFGSANYAGIAKWAQLDLQRIQHRDYVGHLSIFQMFENQCGVFRPSLQLSLDYLPQQCI